MTPLQQRALDTIRELIAVAEIVPTVREVADRLDVGVSHAARLIDTLVGWGYLDKRPGEARGLRLAGVPDLRAVPTDTLAGELARRGVTLAALAPRTFHAAGRAPTCAADSCGAPVQRGHLFCRRHWFALPRDLQSAIMRAWAAGDTRRYQSLVAEARDIADGGQPWRRAS